MGRLIEVNEGAGGRIKFRGSLRLKRAETKTGPSKISNLESKRLLLKGAEILCSELKKERRYRERERERGGGGVVSGECSLRRVVRNEQ